MKTSLAVSLLVFSTISGPVVSEAHWVLDGNALCTATGLQEDPMIVSDGLGGAIVTWQDWRSGNSDIYAQRLNASGVVQWTADGVALCTAANGQISPTVVSDGAGGAIVTWGDWRSGNSDIYAQRVNASGVVQWTADGVALCTAAENQISPQIVSDGAGGAIVMWPDYRNWPPDIYAQRVNASGVVQWVANGVALCNEDVDVHDPSIVSDGAGGAIVAWWDGRSGIGYDIYAQRVSVSGTAQWAAAGVALCTAVLDQYLPTIASDGAGGAIVTWGDWRSGNSNIYAQRVKASGAVQWTANGVALCAATSDQISPKIVSDGAGGAIAIWPDDRNWPTDLYAQRVNASGAVQWVADGVALCTNGDAHDPSIVSDGAGGAIMAWWDWRSGYSDIYAQRVSVSGAVQWVADGVALCTAGLSQAYPMIASDGAGAAIVTWLDSRNGPNSDIYAQRVDIAHGYWGQPDPIVVSVGDIRGDQGGRVKVNWYASDRDALDQRFITYYSIWRATDAAAALEAASHGTTVAGPSDVKADFTGKAVWTQHLPTSDYYWEWVGNQDAHYRTAYTYSTPTRADSTSQGTATEYFFVSAQTDDPFVFFDSNVMSGHSVDNLAPAAPLFLIAQRVGADVQLRWNRAKAPDVRDYSVYRASVSGVTPVPVNFLASSDDTLAVDDNAPPTALYYIVTANDVHENQSVPSNESSVGATTNVGTTPSITRLTVLQNYPNPFAGSTELSVGLPASGPIAIEVYDVVGHRVRGIERAGVKGWQRVTLAGVDERGRPLSSGVYFYKVRAGGESITRKMLITR